MGRAPSSAITEQQRLRGADLEWRSVEGEVVALDVSESLYLGVNRSGRALWEALADGATRSELSQALIDEYGIDRASAERDTDAFLAELDRRGLLASGAPQPEPGAGPPA